jgi:polygalacturonase
MDFQHLIDQCAARGGGRVVIPPGLHVTGTLFLRDGVTLHLAAGATLQGSASAADYAPAEDGFVEGCGQTMGRALIRAHGASRIAITGEQGSRILGCQDGFRPGTPGYSDRPFLVRLVGCRAVHLEGVELERSPAWCCALQDCEEIVLRRMVIENHGANNNDGLDLDSCRHVLVEDCHVCSDDDALVLKSTYPTENRDIEVRRCTLASAGAAIKFGTESYGDMRRIHIHHCRILQGTMGAVKLFSVDGGVLEDIVLEDIELRQCTMPIFLRLGRRCRCFHPGESPKPAGDIRNILFRRLHGKIVPHPRPIHHSCLTIMGLPEKPIRDIRFEGLDLEFPGEAQSPQVASVPENESGYPEVGFYGPMPASCLFQRGARQVVFQDCRRHLASPDCRPEEVIL